MAILKAANEILSDNDLHPLLVGAQLVKCFWKVIFPTYEES